MKYQVGNDFDLPDLVRTQADEGRIELVFEAGGAEYTVSGSSRKATTTTTRLTGPRPSKATRNSPRTPSPKTCPALATCRPKFSALSGWTQSRSSTASTSSKGDITRLIHASTEDRRKILDGLLGLNRLDEYVDRMEDARREYKKAKRDSNSRLDETKKRLQDLPAEDEINPK